VGDLGDRIRARRKELGWTGTELARRAGISKSFLSEVENGKRRVGADTLLALGNALGLPLDRLMRDAHEPHRPGEPVTADLPPSLLTFAAAADPPFRHVLALYRMARVIRDYRPNDRKPDLAAFDWRRFYEAVREFL
jgi:transcriptional regulator with XRE-family HTH domain